MKMNKVAVLLCATVMAVSGCSSEVAEEPSEPGADSQAQSSPAAEAPDISEPVDATVVAEELQSASDTATTIVTVTEENDPNDLIGRPNGYESAAILYDSEVTCDSLGAECGVTIEVYPDGNGARGRAEYIQGIYREMPMLGTEWNYVKDSILLRVAGEVKPSSAQAYADQFGGEQVSAAAE